MHKNVAFSTGWFPFEESPPLRVRERERERERMRKV